MRINSFSSGEAINIFQRDLQRARSKTCPLSNISFFENYSSLADSTDRRLRFHAKSVLAALKLPKRDYRVLTCGYQDTHNEIEKLGCQQYFDSYCVLLTLENRLDLVLQKCCGADPTVVRSIPNYDFLSFNLLNLNFEVSDNITMHSFRGFDRSLDVFINSCYNSPPDEEPPTGLEVLTRFYRGILMASTSIVETVAMCVYKELNLSLRSQGFSNFVFGALKNKRSIPDFITIDIDNRELELPLHVLKRGEYLEKVERGEIL